MKLSVITWRSPSAASGANEQKDVISAAAYPFSLKWGRKRCGSRALLARPVVIQDYLHRPILAIMWCTISRLQNCDSSSSTLSISGSPPLLQLFLTISCIDYPVILVRSLEARKPQYILNLKVLRCCDRTIRPHLTEQIHHCQWSLQLNIYQMKIKWAIPLSWSSDSCMVIGCISSSISLAVRPRWLLWGNLEENERE